jgi:hypothetical protein
MQEGQMKSSTVRGQKVLGLRVMTTWRTVQPPG